MIEIYNNTMCRCIVDAMYPKHLSNERHDESLVGDYTRPYPTEMMMPCDEIALCMTMCVGVCE